MGGITKLASALAALALPVTAQAQDCGRQCLIDMADSYVAALVAHDPGRAPFAADAVTVENAKRIAPGEGLWASLTGGPDGFAIHVPDPVSQQVGLMTVLKGAEGKPTLVGIRLKRESGRIVEAEHMVAPNLDAGQLANLQAPRPALLREVPYEYADSRGRLIHIGKGYYDALDLNNSAHAPMADDCERRENGGQTARLPVSLPASASEADPTFGLLAHLGCAAQMDTNMWEYITRIDNRRVEIADTVTGLVWGMSHFRHAFETSEFPILGVPGVTVRRIEANPFDLPAIHIYKVWGGKIHEIEAMGFLTLYQSQTGWEE